MFDTVKAAQDPGAIFIMTLLRFESRPAL